MATAALILAGAGYLATFSALWAALLPVGWPWLAVAWAAPLTWAAGLMLRRPAPVVAGLVALAGMACAAALRGGVLPAVAGMAGGLWAWDLALFGLRTAGAAAPPHRSVLGAHLARATLSGALGCGAGAGLAVLRLRLPFWGLAGLVVLAWAAVVLLTRGTGALYAAHSGRVASGKRSSSGPTA
ncbi:MAG: hypothetical protein ACP5G2_08195 [Candidatus Bipolaricaulaceae bacterium]